MNTPNNAIVVQFKSESDLKEFCGQMSDGWGEVFCSFNPVFETVGGQTSNVKMHGLPLYEVKSVRGEIDD
jgi:hypothetical protein